MSKSKSKKPVTTKVVTDYQAERNEKRMLRNRTALRNMKSGKATKKDGPFIQAWLEGTVKHLAKFIPESDSEKK